MKLNTSVGNFAIRKAAIGDSEIILNFIKELAEYEKLLDEVTATEELSLIHI